VLGVAISIANYRYQQRVGRKPVFPLTTLRRIPNSTLVVLSAESAHNREVVQAVTAAPEGRSLVFVYLGQLTVFPLQPMAINDPYFRDNEAKDIFGEAAALCQRKRIPAYFIYRIGGPAAILDVWRIVRAADIVTDAHLAKVLAKDVSPEYLRYQQSDGVTVAHLVKHHAQTMKTTPDVSVPGGTGRGPRATPPVSRAPGEKSATHPESDQRRRPEEPERVAPAQETTTGGEASDEYSGSGIEDYVWTGTQLVHKSELPQTPESEGRSEDNEKEQE
jgi:hypothetical protein